MSPHSFPLALEDHHVFNFLASTVSLPESGERVLRCALNEGGFFRVVPESVLTRWVLPESKIKIMGH